MIEAHTNAGITEPTELAHRVGVRPAAAQALLGHSDGKVTRKHYRAKGGALNPIVRLEL